MRISRVIKKHMQNIMNVLTIGSFKIYSWVGVRSDIINREPILTTKEHKPKNTGLFAK